MVTNNAINVATAAIGTVLQGAGIGVAPLFSTATYPLTTTINQILFSSAANTITGLATAASGVFDTTAGGVPQVDITNFAVLTTGVQVKGNNAATAPPAGFIGEQISNSATTVSLVTGTAKTIATISLTAGIWDISAMSFTACTGAASDNQLSISTATNTIQGSVGVQTAQGSPGVVTAAQALSLCVPCFRATLASTTSYFAVVLQNFSTGAASASARISATRVG